MSAQPNPPIASDIFVVIDGLWYMTSVGLARFLRELPIRRQPPVKKAQPRKAVRP